MKQPVVTATGYEINMAASILNHRQRYATPDEIFWLRSAASHMPDNGLVIILGAGPGIMLAAVKDGNPTIHVFLVDHDTCAYAIQHMREFGDQYSQDVYALEGDSAAVGTKYEGRLADLLIIDADHTELGVRADLISWIPHVKIGGYIFCHDYDATGTWFADQEQYPGVKVAVDAIMSNYRYVGRVGTSIIFENTVEERDD